MSIKRILICLSVLTASLFGQSHDMDPEIKNYKLSMEKIKAFDTVEHRLMSAATTDPGFKATVNKIGDQKTLAAMIASVDANPKLAAMIKAGGISSREFCLIPLGVMAAGMGDMLQTQYKKDPSSIAIAENIAFYRANKAQIEAITQTWSQEK